jgi:hypothetical protein
VCLCSLLAAALVLSEVSSGVCSREPLSVLSVAGSLATARFFPQLFLGVSLMSKCQFSVFSALRFLQRWFFGLTWGLLS